MVVMVVFSFLSISIYLFFFISRVSSFYFYADSSPSYFYFLVDWYMERFRSHAGN